MHTIPFLLLLIACHSGKPADSGTDTPTDTAPDEPFFPTFPTSSCGGPTYDWAPLDRMGEIVESEDMAAWTLSASALDALLAVSEIDDFSPVPYGVISARVRYITQDRGREVEATALVAYPDVDDGSSFPMVMFAHGTTGFMDACAPTAGDLEDVAIPLLFASQGYAVVAPDYLGMNGFGEPAGYLHPYLAPEPTAVACLDSLRALARHAEAESLDITFDPSRTVLWGGSEGGFAVFWAERYLPGYAPEFQLVADISLVPPTDVLGLGVWGATTYGLPTTAIAGTLAVQNLWYGDGIPLADLSSALTDQKPGFIATNLANDLAASCSDIPCAEGVDSVDDVLQPGFAQALASADLEAIQPFSCFLQTATLHATALPMPETVPTLVVLSELDDLVITQVVRDDLPVLCEQGYRLEIMECAGAKHAEGAYLTLPYQVQWMKDRLAGVALDESALCVVPEPVECAPEK